MKWVTGTVRMSDLILHKVLEGPIDHETTTGEYLYSVVYLAEDTQGDGQLFVEECFYDNLSSAYEEVKKVNSVAGGVPNG